MDPIRKLLDVWSQEREVFARAGSEDLIELSKTHTREIEAALTTLSEATIPYSDAAALTGYALGSLKNMGIANVGTRARPAFRLADLPFKAGHASAGKALMAATILRARVRGLEISGERSQGGSITPDSHPYRS